MLTIRKNKDNFNEDETCEVCNAHPINVAELDIPRLINLPFPHPYNNENMCIYILCNKKKCIEYFKLLAC